MEETKFKIEWRDLAKCWLISRYLPSADAWIIQDTRLYQGSALRYARKRAGKGAHLIETVIKSQERVTILTYRRLTGIK